MCDQMNIKITSEDEDLQCLLEEYQLQQQRGNKTKKGNLGPEEPLQHPKFSIEAFQEALMEWIVDDNQVQ